jgi:beta-glucosidase
MVRGLVDRNMTPVVTLHHFSNPVWIEEIGGWENEKIIEYFEAYVQKTVEALKEYVTLWCTINEPNVLAYNGYLTGTFPPGKNNFLATVRAMTNMVKAHAVAFHAIRKIQSVSRVGLAIHNRSQIPGREWLPLDRWVAGVHTRLFNDFFPRALQDGVLRFPFFRRRLPEVKGTQDYLGLNYYTQDQIVFSLLKPGDLFGRRFFPPNTEVSKSGMISNRPSGLFAALKWARQFGVPIIVAENGVDDDEDRLRPRYLCQHIHALWRAVNENIPIKGYFHWTLVDNFEWERGWTQRFGLWALDPETQARQKRPSADLYAEICKSNSLSADVVGRFVPELVEEMFPG